MNEFYQLQEIQFVWHREKAKINLKKHGVSFEQACEAFFDPFLKMIEAGTSEEHREALIGMDEAGKLLFVVHLQQENDVFRIISARKATQTEKRFYESK